MTRILHSTLAVLLALAFPVAAQDPEDDALEEQRRQDERYHRRYAEAEPTPAPDDAAREALARATELVRDANHRALRTATVRLDTDDPRIDLPAVARLLDATDRLFDKVVAGRVEPAPDREPAQLFLLWSYADYNQLVGGSFGRSLVRPKGHYGTLFDAIVVHTDSDAPGALGDTIVHEAAHRLVDRRLYAGSRVPATWLAEGLAEYFARTRVSKDGQSEPGVVGGKAIALFADGSGRSEAAESKARLNALARALREPEAPIAGPVMRADPAAFYGESVTEHYTVSWVLVHWLLHAEDPARTRGFFEFLDLDRRGEGGPETFFRTVGIAESDLDAALRDHVERMRVR